MHRPLIIGALVIGGFALSRLAPSSSAGSDASGTPPTRRIVLIGDSHAQALGPRLKSMGVISDFDAVPGRMLSQVRNPPQADVYLLEFGTNEANNGIHGIGVPNWAAGGTVLWVGPPSVDNERITEAEPYLYDSMRATGRPVFDSRDSTQGTFRYGSEAWDYGIHQTEIGYTNWANALAGWIRDNT